MNNKEHDSIRGSSKKCTIYKLIYPGGLRLYNGKKRILVELTSYCNCFSGLRYVASALGLTPQLDCYNIT